MKWIKRLLVKRLTDADLHAESSNAAAFYMKKQPKLAMVDQQRMANNIAHGFYMGYRKAEEDLGIQ